jgi:multidrug resistance protein, MATE family
VGAAWATTLVRWIIALGMIVYIWRHPLHAVWEARGSFAGWLGARTYRRIGYAAGLSNGLEGSAFLALGLFAGWLGAEAVAAYTIGLNLIALPFMCALGLASATAVRVGNAYGAKRHQEVAFAGWTSLGITLAALGVVGAVFLLFSQPIARQFTLDAKVLALTVPLVGFSAWLLAADGGQVVLAQALRGRSDVWAPTLSHFISYYAIMMPVSYLLAIQLEGGVLGLFHGIFIASLVSVAILSLRFWLLGRRDAEVAVASP